MVRGDSKEPEVALHQKYTVARRFRWFPDKGGGLVSCDMLGILLRC